MYSFLIDDPSQAKGFGKCCCEHLRRRRPDDQRGRRRTGPPHGHLFRSTIHIAIMLFDCFALIGLPPEACQHGKSAVILQSYPAVTLPVHLSVVRHPIYPPFFFFCIAHHGSLIQNGRSLYLSQYCLPHGIVITRVPEEPRFSGFVTARPDDGTRLYGGALLFFEQLPGDEVSTLPSTDACVCIHSLSLNLYIHLHPIIVPCAL